MQGVLTGALRCSEGVDAVDAVRLLAAFEQNLLNVDAAHTNETSVFPHGKDDKMLQRFV